MIYLRLDCVIEQGIAKNLGQVTDWDVSELISLMEVILEECTDDLEDLPIKPRFTKISQFKRLADVTAKASGNTKGETKSGGHLS